MSGVPGNRQGRFITFEGGEGAGKSTQAALLVEALKRRGIDAVLTREPGGTPGAEAVRRLLLDTDAPDWHPRAEALLFAAARSDHVERLIRPALAQGRWVICDRFVDSSRAYQGGGDLTDGDVIELHRIGSGGLLADMTILLDLAAEMAGERLSMRDRGVTDRIGGREDAFHTRVLDRFAHFARDEPTRFRRVDGGGSAETVHTRVLAALAPILEAAP